MGLNPNETPESLRSTVEAVTHQQQAFVIVKGVIGLLTLAVPAALFVSLFAKVLTLANSWMAVHEFPVIPDTTVNPQRDDNDRLLQKRNHDACYIHPNGDNNENRDRSLPPSNS